MRKILIIDGDHDFVRMVMPFLENSNFEVAGANNLEEARSEIDRFVPDLVLLSRDLIGESGNLIPDGLGLLKEMKTRREWKKIPVIFLVSGADADSLEKLRRLKYKADDYARKPLEDNDLLRRIENLTGFDPEETSSTLRMEMEKISRDGSEREGSSPSLQGAVEKELQELFGRLSEELAQPEQEIDFAPELKDLSPEQLKNELEFVQTLVRERAQQYRRLQEKWKKAIAVLEERIIRLEREKQKLQDELSAARSEREGLAGENRELTALLEQARDLIQGFEKLGEKFEKNLETAHDLLRQFSRLRDK